MKRALIIFMAVTKNWLRSRSGVFFSIMFPVLLLLVFGAVFGGQGASTYTLFVQNLDVDTESADLSATNASEAFIEILNSTETFTIRDIPANVSDLRSYARDILGPVGGNIRIVVISEGFEGDLMNGTFKVRVGICYTTLQMMLPYLNETERIAVLQGIDQLSQFNATLPDQNASLTLILDDSDQSSAIVKSIVMNIANSFNYELIGAKNVVTFEEEPFTERQLRTVDFYLPGVISAFIMTNGIIGVTANTTEFKRRGIIKRLSITPLSKVEWILGNVLSQTLLNLILTAIIIIVGWLVFSVQAIPDIYSIILIFLGSVLFSGIGMVLSGLIKDVEAASAIGNAIAFPMMFLSGAYWPVEMMPDYMQSIAKVLPLTYFSEGLRSAMIYKYTEGIIFNMGVVSILAAAFIIIGAIATRWKEK